MLRLKNLCSTAARRFWHHEGGTKAEVVITKLQPELGWEGRAELHRLGGLTYRDMTSLWEGVMDVTCWWGGVVNVTLGLGMTLGFLLGPRGVCLVPVEW